MIICVITPNIAKSRETIDQGKKKAAPKGGFPYESCRLALVGHQQFLRSHIGLGTGLDLVHA